MRSSRFVAACAIAVLSSVFLLTPFAIQPASGSSEVTTHDTFDTDEMVVALTFDVTFDRGAAEYVLDTLRDYGVVSTWAITGIWAENNPDLMRRIANEGHHLINHTWHHFSFTGEYTGSSIHEPAEPLSHDEIVEQLVRTDELIIQQVGVATRPYIRPPYGDYDDETLAAFASAGFTENIMWTVDTYGWYGYPIAEVQQRALDAAQPGANILMHIGHGSTDEAALPGIIEGFRAQGYEFATVEDFVEGQYADPASQFRARTGSDLSDEFDRLRSRINRMVREPLLAIIAGETEHRSDSATPTWYSSRLR
jgi:peptidoglycan-N-acetylglucosamine deacetylase